jgi:integrase
LKVDTSEPGFLRKRTVRNETTREQYSQAVRLFQVFAVSMGVLSLVAIGEVDAALEKYFESLFVKGVGQYTARCALYGWAYLHPNMSTKPRHHYPLAKAALKGWKNLEPGGSKDPCPWEVALLLAEWMMNNGYVKMAAFVILCFDTYVRPGILSLIRRENVLPPVPGVNVSYRHWSLVLSPKAEGVPTKVGEFDDSLIVGSTGREWVSKITELLWRKSLPNAFIFQFSLREVEKVFKLATTALSLTSLHVTPHSLRHGGPSHDVYFNIRNLDQVQRRGFWKALSSVRRYEKHACLQRQLNKLTQQQQVAANAASRTVPARLLLLL